MPDLADVGARLRAHLEPILADWETRVRAALPAAKRHDSAALRDGLPLILEHTANQLAARPGAPDADIRQLSHDHARQRARSGRYSLEQVIAEYHILEQTVLDALERDGPLPREPRDALRRWVQACVIESAAEFAAATTQALAHDRELYLHLVEGVRDYAIFSIDPKGVVTTWNEGAARMKGYAPEEIIGRHFSMLYDEDSRQRGEPMEHLRMASERGRYRGEGWRAKKGGERFLADVLITPIYVRGRHEGYSKVVADLTDRGKLLQERELSRTQILDMQAEQSTRDEFIARLAHDLRTPLNTAKMSAELLRTRPSDPTELDALMVRISENLGRADAMIRDLLDLGRLRAGEKPPLDIARCVLNEIVSDTLRELATVYGDRFAMRANAEISGDWDPSAIRRIIENLCSNSAKYGAPGHPITATLTQTATEAQIAVHNWGEPIPAGESERLFDQFARVGPLPARTQGWGIGLAVVKGLVEAHGGSVRVDSIEDAGTTFKIDLPLHPATPEAAVSPRAAVPSEVQPRRG